MSSNLSKPSLVWARIVITLFRSEIGMQTRVAIVAADVTSEGLVVSFSDGTASLFAPAFLYNARAHDGNTPLIEQGNIVADSPFEKGLKDD